MFSSSHNVFHKVQKMRRRARGETLTPRRVWYVLAVFFFTCFAVISAFSVYLYDRQQKEYYLVPFDPGTERVPRVDESKLESIVDFLKKQEDEYRVLFPDVVEITEDDTNVDESIAEEAEVIDEESDS